jgi:hypothetical protein
VLDFQSAFDRGATISDAAWASAQPRPASFALYASVQGDTVEVHQQCAREIDRMAHGG